MFEKKGVFNMFKTFNDFLHNEKGIKRVKRVKHPPLFKELGGV